MFSVGKTNHNDEPYIEPVSLFFSQTEFLLNRSFSCRAGKIVRLLPNVNRQKTSPPIIKPVKKKGFINGIYIVTCLDTNALRNCLKNKCVNETLHSNNLNTNCLFVLH